MTTTPTATCSVATDADLVALWLSGRPPTTLRAYERDVACFRAAVGRPLPEVDLADLRRFVAGLTGADASRARRVAVAKSLLTFGHRLGYLDVNVGRLVATPTIRSTLHERVLDEDEVHRVLRRARRPRDRALIKVLYFAGLRVSEAVSLCWRDVGERWLTANGKGSKTRTVLVPTDVVGDLRRLRGDEAKREDPVFAGRGDRALSARQARAIVTKLADQALGRPLPPHALRHSHATVALLRGAPIHLVQQTLGHASLATTARYLHVRPGEGSSDYLVAHGIPRRRGSSSGR